jgi:hypothetical protein
MYKDALEEARAQITSLKERLAVHREAQHLRSVMINRNALTSSPIHKRKNQVQDNVSESGVERSSYGSDDVPLHTPSSDARKLVQTKLDFGAVHEACQAVPPVVETSSIPQTHVSNN